MIRIPISVVAMLFAAQCVFAQGALIPTDQRQIDFLNAYKFVLSESSSDYRFTSATMDTTLFPRWGEESVYWVTSGPNKGSFVYPDRLPASYSSVASESYMNYDWRAANHYAVSFKAYSDAIAVFKASAKQEGNTVSWEAVYFKNLIESFLIPNISVYIDENRIDSSGIPWTTQLLILPAFAVNGSDWKYCIDNLFDSMPKLAQRLKDFLGRGGTIYAEGNAVYMIEKLGLLAEGAVDFQAGIEPNPATGSIELDVIPSQHPVSFAKDAAGTTIYASTIPAVNPEGLQVIARAKGTEIPVVFALSGPAALNGRVICNTALPAVGGNNGVEARTPEGRQFQWVLNAIMYAFSTNVDVTRSVFNEVPDSLSVGHNAAAYDHSDTLEVRVKLRNLSFAPIDGITVNESIRSFFSFVDVVTPDVDYTINGTELRFSGISIPAHSEMVIVYRIATPDPKSPVHENVDAYLSWDTYIYASLCTVTYQDGEGAVSYRKYRNYVNMMFAARLVADTDCNWKNFLGLYYQPFKVFMMMENKERTPAMDTRYVQYIPKDVPFYWTDKTIDVPVLKTPGGKFVDVLRGSNDEAHPEYDMDSDGHPDAWLDTASIYPKGFTLEETSVYWLNPWEHLRNGNTLLYEDLDHDGLRAQDTDGDGIVDIEEPGDKMRVWKVVWTMGTVAGHQYFDPYCYYELWIDPPDLVPMSAGVSKAYGKLDEDVSGMFYPHTPDIEGAELADTSWSHWMERDKDGNVVWKQLIFQKIHNYEGFTFIDTVASGYQLRPTDRCAGTVPQPHREFIAVLSLGGEEIDMNNPAPEKSNYSNLEYTTMFGEKRNWPIRTTYTYWAPLPNPLQFEYITNNFTITDSSNTQVLQFLPAFGKANLRFEIDASTEYTYYWIRNAGHDVDFNDPSQAIESADALGDGVFGYMIYDIPKGMGGYKITLPTSGDGKYDIDRIVQIDGKPFAPWLTNKNTANEISITEDAFAYHVYIPQLLIPPALDDDNFDGVDDWIDDRGDRFCSSTGFLHDPFMLGNGEEYLDHPKEPFKDDIYGWVTKGWYAGEDETYGDDFFETLGKTHITIHAQFEGDGREGSVDISKGGWLVVEEIFGGSPWVLFSHALSAHSEGVNYSITSAAQPSVARFGADTVYVRHIIEDKGEPHSFDAEFDPYRVSYGYGQSTITTFAGGKDPGGFIMPNTNLSTIIDAEYDHKSLTLFPAADKRIEGLEDFPKTVEGNFIQVLVEVSNGSDYNWTKTSIAPVIEEGLGGTKLVMSYVSYPRPLVPSMVDPVTGKVVHLGDDPGAFRTGWRFNQPEGEMLVRMGNEMNLIQPSRRAYYVFLFSIDQSLPAGIYDIRFKLSGDLKKYDGTYMDEIAYAVPPCKFAISQRDASGSVMDYQKLVLGQGTLSDIKTRMISPQFTGTENVRWSAKSVNYTSFDTLRNALAAQYDHSSGIETIDMSQFGAFPTVDITKLYVLEEGRVLSGTTNEALRITKQEELTFTSAPFGEDRTSYRYLTVSTVGPKLILDRTIAAINGVPYTAGTVPVFSADAIKEIEVLFKISNRGSSLVEDVSLSVRPGPYFFPDPDALPANASVDGGILQVACASLVPGQTRQIRVQYNACEGACATVYDSTALVNSMSAVFGGSYMLSGKLFKESFTVPDEEILDLPAYDFQSRGVTATPEKARPGQRIELTANIATGPIAADDVPVEFYAVVDRADTLLIGSQLLKHAPANSATQVSAEVTVPENAKYIELLARVDPGNLYGEFCEYNNVVSLTLPLCADYWILDVTNAPNPLRDETQFTYTLPQEVTGLTLRIYTLDGKEVAALDPMPGTVGKHNMIWQNTGLPAGAYIYTVYGMEESGVQKRYSGKLVIAR